jgi:TolB-like protein
MEHIIQFGVTIDDKKIEERVMDGAERQIIDGLKREIGNTILARHSAYGYKYDSTTLTTVGEQLVSEWLNEHSEEIVELAAAKVADKVSRTKAWKEKFGETLKEEAANG